VSGDRIPAFAELVTHHANTVSLRLGFRPET
jgi:hypothetical protein